MYVLDPLEKFHRKYYDLSRQQERDRKKKKER